MTLRQLIMELIDKHPEKANKQLGVIQYNLIKGMIENYLKTL